MSEVPKVNSFPPGSYSLFSPILSTCSLHHLTMFGRTSEKYVFVLEYETIMTNTISTISDLKTLFNEKEDIEITLLGSTYILRLYGIGLENDRPKHVVVEYLCVQ